MERELPRFNIEGTDFLVDVANFELREASNEKNKIRLEDMVETYQGYSIRYDPKNKKVLDDFDLSTVRINIPEFVVLDPVGMSRKYNISLDEIKTKSDFSLMVDQEALHKRLKLGILPIVTIAGHTFYPDARIDLLRPKDDFRTLGISFSQIAHYYSEEQKAYVIPYNPKSHEFQEFDFNKITQYPKDLIAVKFPHERELDPVGWNRRRGYSETYLLKETGLKMKFAAETVPWHKTTINELMKINRKWESLNNAGMISSNSDPDYIFEQYKGYIIASHKENVIGKDIDNLFIVYRSEDFPDNGFIIGLDDSKLSGRRKSIPHNIDDAKGYIDWATNCRKEKAEIKPDNPTPQKSKGRKM